jgi:hypothetical protein
MYCGILQDLVHIRNICRFVKKMQEGRAWIDNPELSFQKLLKQ